MKIRFTQRILLQWGERLVLRLTDNLSELEMQCDHTDHWHIEIETTEHLSRIAYTYLIVKPDGSSVPEGKKREIILPDKRSERLTLYDHRYHSKGDTPFLSAAFTRIFFKRTPHTVPDIVGGNTDLCLRLYNPQVESGRHIAIVGNQDILGNWQLDRKVRLDESAFPYWSVSLQSKDIRFPLEYKYLLVDTDTDTVLQWDQGENRILEHPTPCSQTIVTDEHFIRTIPSWRGAGVAIPVFSLRSDNGFGVGEFDDLKKLVDWAVLTRQRIIQTLPVNDTTCFHSNMDSYPYNAISVYALHPLYLNLEKVGKPDSRQRCDYYRAKRQELNRNDFVDYQQVMDAKWQYLWEIYPAQSPQTFASEDYRVFFRQNSEWLLPYAAFSCLRDIHGTADKTQWGKYERYDKKEIEQFASPGTAHYDRIGIHYFVQYHLHRQLLEVHRYATSKGIALKGDIPIGVNPQSVDTWVSPHLFHLDKQTGAPPDDFSPTGQNWGFPTYNWQQMEKDGYCWWKKRFLKMAEYFDAYRIDHILGFFRIWEMPSDAVWALSGTFSPALPLSKEELQTRGFEFNETMLRPCIRRHNVDRLFGRHADETLDKYLTPTGPDAYAFKPEYDTQKKIAASFKALGRALGAEETIIRDGLYHLHCETLFIRDPHLQDRFHPRIAIHTTASFGELSERDRETLNGIYFDFYYHRHTTFWKEQALNRLPVLTRATDMLVCGEDLGMVPSSVPEVMNELEILTLEVQRMSKRTDISFVIPSDVPYRSVFTTSTHDMTPLRAWWEENRAFTQRFYTSVLKCEGLAPLTCTPSIARLIIGQQLNSPAMLVILPWQDWLSIDARLRINDPHSERINTPDNPDNFWKYRMHITLETLLSSHDLNVLISSNIESAGR